jgi:hypothetical protein
MPSRAGFVSSLMQHDCCIHDAGSAGSVDAGAFHADTILL